MEVTGIRRMQHEISAPNIPSLSIINIIPVRNERNITSLLFIVSSNLASVCSPHDVRAKRSSTSSIVPAHHNVAHWQVVVLQLQEERLQYVQHHMAHHNHSCP